MAEQDLTLKQRLLKGGIGLGGLSLIGTALSLLAGLVIARALGPEDYGFYVFAGSLISLIAIPTQLGLPRLLSREVASMLARGQYQLLRGIEHWSQTFALSAAFVIGGLVGSAFLWFAEMVPALDPKVFTIALLMLPMISIAGRDQGCLSGLRKVVQAKWPTALLKPVVTLLSLGLIYWLSVKLTPSLAMWISVISVLCAALVTRLILIRFWPGSKLPVEGRSRSTEWFKSLIPFGLLAAVSLINAKTDLLMLGILTSAQEVGRYSIAVQGALLVSFALSAFNGVLAPNIAHLHAVGEMTAMQRVLNHSTAILLIISTVVVTVLVVFGKPLISLLFGESYLPSYVPMVILGLGQLVNVSFGSVGQFLTMSGHEKDSLRALSVSAVVNVLLNASLIPAYGGIGAAIATSLSLVVWNVLLSVSLYRRLGLTPGPIALRRV